MCHIKQAEVTESVVQFPVWLCCGMSLMQTTRDFQIINFCVNVLGARFARCACLVRALASLPWCKREVVGRGGKGIHILDLKKSMILVSKIRR